MNQTAERYLYLKNGDAALQIETIAALEDQAANGPDGFIVDFLNSVQGHQVLFLSIFKNSRRHVKIDNVEAKCFPSYIAGLGPLGTPIARTYFHIAGVLRALKFKPTRIICVRRGGILWLGYLLSQWFRAPVIYISHDRIKLRSRNPVAKMVYALDEFCIRQMDSCVCQGEFTHHQLLLAGVPNSAIHRFDGSYRNFYEATRAYFAQENKVVERSAILYVGRIEKSKGVLDLITACAPLLKHNGELRLVYAGIGGASVELQKRSKELNIEDKVTLLGAIPYSNIPALMASAKVLVTSTRTTLQEGHRHSVVEGFICGLPAIAPNFGPYPYYIDQNTNGLLYEPNSCDDLANKIALVVNDNDFHRRLSDGALKFSKNIIDPKTSFGSAISEAFEGAMK